MDATEEISEAAPPDVRVAEAGCAWWWWLIAMILVVLITWGWRQGWWWGGATAPIAPPALTGNP